MPSALPNPLPRLWRSRLLVFLAGLCLLVANARASDAPRVWRVCIADWSLPPFLYSEPGRQGLIETLMIEAGRDVGLNVLILRLPSRRCALMAQAEEVDAAVAAVTAANLARYAFPMHQGEVDSQRRLVTVNLVWVKRAGSPLDWDGRKLLGVEQPGKIKVGIRIGFPALREELEALGATVDDTALQATQLFNKLSRARVDLAVCLQQEVPGALADPSLGRLVVLPKAMKTFDFYAITQRHLSPELQVRVEGWWEAIGRRREAILNTVPAQPR